MLQRFIVRVLSKDFMVLFLTIRSVIYFKLVFAYVVVEGSIFIFF